MSSDSSTDGSAGTAASVGVLVGAIVDALTKPANFDRPPYGSKESTVDSFLKVKFRKTYLNANATTANSVTPAAPTIRSPIISDFSELIIKKISSYKFGASGCLSVGVVERGWSPGAGLLKDTMRTAGTRNNYFSTSVFDKSTMRQAEQFDL